MTVWRDALSLEGCGLWKNEFDVAATEGWRAVAAWMMARGIKERPRLHTWLMKLYF